MSQNQRVTIITSDTHAGADLLAYRPYLERAAGPAGGYCPDHAR